MSPVQPNNDENPYPLRVIGHNEPLAEPQNPYPPQAGCCAVCGEPANPANANRSNETGALVHKATCADEYIRAQKVLRKEWRDYEDAMALRRMRETFEQRMRAKLEQLPRFRPVFGSDDFLKAVPHLKFRTVAEKYTLERGSLLLKGPSGSGKTTTAQALVQRLAAEISEAPEILEYEEYCQYEFRKLRRRNYSLGCLGSFVWCTGFDLAYARRNHALGSEPPMLTNAKSASFLVIDDVGSEPLADNVLFEVVNERYAQRLPTIVTTGLAGEAFAARYGDALERRLIEKGIGAPIEVPPVKKGNLNLVKP